MGDLRSGDERIELIVHQEKLPVQTNERIPWWVVTIVILASFLLSAGAVIALVHPAMLVSPHDIVNDAARIYAGYFASRNLALAIMLMLWLILRKRSSLSSTLFLVALVQLLDTGMDCVEGRWSIVPGVVVLGLICFFAAVRLLQRGSFKSSIS